MQATRPPGGPKLKNFEFYLPARSIFGAGVVQRVRTEAAKLEHRALPGIDPNPRVSTCAAGARLCKEKGIEGVSTGEGSVLDASKAIAAMALDDGDPRGFFNRYPSDREDSAAGGCAHRGGDRLVSDELPTVDHIGVTDHLAVPRTSRMWYFGDGFWIVQNPEKPGFPFNEIEWYHFLNPPTNVYGLYFESSEPVVAMSEPFIKGVHSTEEWGMHLRCPRLGVAAPDEVSEEVL